MRSELPSVDDDVVPLNVFMRALCDYAVSFPMARHALAALTQLDTPDTATHSYGSFQSLYAMLTCVSVDATVSWSQIQLSAQSFRSIPTAHHGQLLLRQLNAPLGACLSITDSVEAMIRRRCHTEAPLHAHSASPLTCSVQNGVRERSIQQVELSWSDGCVLFDVHRLHAVISEGLDPAAGE